MGTLFFILLFGYSHSWSTTGALQGSSHNPYVHRQASIVWETVLSNLVFYNASLEHPCIVVDDHRLVDNDVIGLHDQAEPVLPSRWAAGGPRQTGIPVYLCTPCALFFDYKACA